MFQGEIVHVSTGPARGHVLAAVVATVLSIAIHVALIALLPNLRFELPSGLDEYRHDPEFRALHVRNVEPYTPPEPPPAASGGAASPEWVKLTEVVRELGLNPEEVVIEPPSITDESLIGETEPVINPEQVEAMEVWEPRQEILEMDSTLAAADLLKRDRYRVPDVERVNDAPDIVIPVDREFAGASRPALRVGTPGAAIPAAAIELQEAAAAADALGVGDREVIIGEPAAVESGELLSETPAEITTYKPIEDLLHASVSTYTTLRDFRYGYFRIELERAGADLLPVIPKDIVFVQDCSASMSEQRLYFCRKGLINCLAALQEGDRFNVVAFRDRAEFCFPKWMEATPAALKEAATFISGLEAVGNTDIYGSMKSLLNREQTPGRPVIAMMISDGIPTRGMVDSSDIIGEFTRLNDGRISVFSMGTALTANSYLLDLISYCNRGDASNAAGGRWGIPESMLARLQSIRRPVLSEVRFQFAGGGNVEVYPKLTSNLYLDKSLQLYGRYPRGTKDLVFQVVGLSPDAKCDMIFTLALDDNAAGKDKEIRSMWGKQKIYHLIGQYARTPDDAILTEIRRTSRSYGVRIPHRGRF